ncbi:Zn-dependent membrane protease YugP [Pullulanibacillus pueri]|uniref:Zinc metallopeptidase n=1 Tax=Pullulanibacillus pueri TaxID=1437324 RepID=A0A8J2ZUM9_9BACL|nr:zinc metallopeptidase [Pullulanibacillus pueri]MBM7681445.1 Zn-dependent membrane protease YugP [Pullulanibacillus pueri]GGH78906.1 zinc metallopeptidase [Pullulanibacillus pueri]
MSLGAYLIYFVIIMAIPIWAQSKVRGTFNKYVQVPNETGLTGAQVARRILDEHGLYNVDIEEIPGQLSDHYDPRSKVLRLSSAIYHGNSVAGTAVAAHEVGHAIQDKEDYVPLRFRHALVPVANFGSSMAWIFIIAGMIFSATLGLIGVIFFAAAVLFQIVTLPVEFNASRRAMVQLETLGLIHSEEKRSARKVLSAAALTYVAAALVAVLELLRFVLMFVGTNDED